MLDAISSLFTLRWTQQRQFHPLSSEVKRTYVTTPNGDLELLISGPKSTNRSSPPILFVHGGSGHASVWLEWMTYLHEAGYGGTLYSFSARNHGASYAVPYFRMVYSLGIDDIADDLTSCVEAVKEKEGGMEPVLVSHSSGGGLTQYVLANERIKCRALCLVDAVPHSGNLCMYANWARHDPWFLLRSFFHLQHPNSPLSSVRLVHGAFFCKHFPTSLVQEFARWMPAYECMGWPIGMFGSFWAWLRGKPRWLEPVKILRSVTSLEGEKLGDGVCIMVGSDDMMLDAGIWDRQAAELRVSVQNLRRESGRAGEENLDGATIQSESGIRLVVVHGAGHHLQNDLQRDVGAEALLKFAQQC